MHPAPSYRAELKESGRGRRKSGSLPGPGHKVLCGQGGLMRCVTKASAQGDGLRGLSRRQARDTNTVVVSGACCHRVLQAAGFRDSLPALGVTSLKSRCGQGHAPSQGSGGRSFLPLPDSGGSGHSWVRGHLPPTCAPVFTWLLLCVCASSCVAYKDPILGFGTHLANIRMTSP